MTTETKVHRFLLAASATGLLALAAVLPAQSAKLKTQPT
jgi:hypothetical protein